MSKSPHHPQVRAMGMKPIEIWVPDVQAAGFATEARRQSRLIAASAHEPTDQAWVDAVSQWPEE
ncbi:MAG: antitoxin MazE family protein [Actinomycetota bacterium]|nr:antitoxin MazE family protein [Actinomycetota bacterium]